MSGIRQRDSVLVHSSCLNAANPTELWRSEGWVHLSDSASWQNGFRQLSCTAGKSDLICSDRWTQKCTSARVTLHSTTATPETAGASLKPRSNRNHLMRAGVYLCLLNFKVRQSLYTSFTWAVMHVLVLCWNPKRIFSWLQTSGWLQQQLRKNSTVPANVCKSIWISNRVEKELVYPKIRVIKEAKNS